MEGMQKVTIPELTDREAWYRLGRSSGKTNLVAAMALAAATGNDLYVGVGLVKVDEVEDMTDGQVPQRAGIDGREREGADPE